MFGWRREKPPAHETEINGWFQWRSGQEEAVQHFGVIPTIDETLPAAKRWSVNQWRLLGG